MFDFNFLENLNCVGPMSSMQVRTKSRVSLLIPNAILDGNATDPNYFGIHMNEISSLLEYKKSP